MISRQPSSRVSRFETTRTSLVVPNANDAGNILSSENSGQVKRNLSLRKHSSNTVEVSIDTHQPVPDQPSPSLVTSITTTAGSTIKIDNARETFL